MTSMNTTPHNTGDRGSVESWLASAGRDRRPGSPLNVPPIPASNFVLGDRRAYSRDDGTPGWKALEEIVLSRRFSRCAERERWHCAWSGRSTTR